MAHIIELTDFLAPELDVYARLTENQLLNRADPDRGIFIAESPKVVERALNAGCIPVSMLVEQKHIEGEARDVIARMPEDVPIFTAPFDVLTQLTGFQLTRGVLCAMKRPALASLDELLELASRIAILEDVVNPTNVGAIFRSAAALGMDAVLLTPACSNPLYRRSIRVSMGTVFQIPWTYIGAESGRKHRHKTDISNESESSIPAWPDQGFELLKKHGFKTCAFALRKDSVSIDDPVLVSEDKLAIILGTEGEGLIDATLDACDYTVKIPMSHEVDSLNVAAASAVAFWVLGKHT